MTGREPAPAGYLVNHPEGIQGTQGLAYDYIIARNGVFVQARNTLITARVQAASLVLRGLGNTTPKLELHQGPIPREVFQEGIQWLLDDPMRERIFTICWNGNAHAVRIPTQSGAAGSLVYRPREESGEESGEQTILECHSHAAAPAFFSETDDRDEQGLRLYAVLGRVDQDPPELRIRLGVYGYFQEIDPREIILNYPGNFTRGKTGRENTIWNTP